MKKDLSLADNVTALSGVGGSYQKKLARLGIKTIFDLLFYFPYRYLDFSKLTLIKDLSAGDIVTVRGRIISITNYRARFRRLTITKAIIKDNSGSLRVVWFNQPYLKRALERREVLLAGEVERRGSVLQIDNPIYQLADTDLVHAGRIVPVYRQSRGISSRWLRSQIKQILDRLELKDFLDKQLKRRYRLISLKDSLKQIHFPSRGSQIQAARWRLSFDELLVIIFQSQQERKKLKARPSYQIKFEKEASQKFINSLPFRLTDDQKRSAWQIITDLKRAQPMNRLLNGDVGSGKTVVAAIGALNVLASGKNVFLMAPTEVLAHQHYRTLKNFFEGFNFKIELFISAKKTVDLAKKLSKTIVIGTQALIQKNITVNDLALVIIDEQQRFGVNQRAKLVERPLGEKIPNLLTMTATPIPRSLSLAIFGNLNVSFLYQKPKQRKPVITKIFSDKHKDQAYRLAENQLKKGRQLFVICPYIDELNGNRRTEKKSVIDQYQRLKKVFPDFKINYLHGQMRSKKKEQIMANFAREKFQILVSTSVVEIGVDIKNAAVMIVESAEQFGLSQLHQFRGRVGRDRHQSYCYLIASIQSNESDRRLKVLASTNDGFKIAQEDLRLRGPGEIFGRRQHGLTDLRFANCFSLRQIDQVRRAVDDLREKDRYRKLLDNQIFKICLNDLLKQVDADRLLS